MRDMRYATDGDARPQRVRAMAGGDLVRELFDAAVELPPAAMRDPNE
jgi:hypothetical protein